MKNQMSKKSMTMTAAMALAGLALPTASMACDVAGPHTHVGQVLSIDGDRFTIRDAQSGGPISFTAGKKMQGSMPAPGDGVTVKYSDGKKGLIAESVH